MKNFLLPLLLFSFIFLFTGCKTQQNSAVPNSSSQQLVENLYFSETGQEYFYRAEIRVYGNEISGVLIIKKTGENEHRIVMTGDFGNKLLDMSKLGNDFTVNYIIPDLDRKAVKKILEKDFAVMLRQTFPVTGYENTGSGNILISKAGNDEFRLSRNSGSQLIHRIEQMQGKSKKTIFNFEAKSAIFADRIEIIHQDINLTILLTAIIK